MHDMLDDFDQLAAQEKALEVVERGVFNIAHHLGQKIQRLASERVAQRMIVEQRWLEDIEQYIGEYDYQTKARFAEDKNRSQVYINITRHKTVAAESRIADMLFPNDDRNFSVDATPIPDLPKVGEAGYEEAQEIVKEARQRARAMQNQIDDQLKESDYHTVGRKVIHDACVFGTGIIKGPVVVSRTSKSWSEIEPGVMVLEREEKFAPAVEHVEIWNFFPDMSARNLAECDSILERKYVTRQDLARMAKRPGFNVNEIKALLREDAKGQMATVPTHLARLRAATTGAMTNILRNRYELWEYHGSVTRDELEACGCCVEDELDEYEAIVLVCNGRVLRASLNPLDTEERPYCVFNYEEDDASVFGYGVPYLLRHIQKVVNGAWRMMLENTAAASGGQIVMNRDAIRPSDGDWGLRPRKIWEVTEPGLTVQQAFGLFEFSSHQQEIMAIYEQAHQLADEITSLPMLAQGERGNAPDTASGMSMLMNSANTVMRRIVKQFDDDVTKPLITRFYDWNMQYNPDPSIKGDFQVDARGSSVLLVKETQTQGMLQLMQFANNPQFAPILKTTDMLRKLAQSMHIAPDDIILSDEEIEQNKQAMQQQEQLQQQQIQLQMAEQQAKIDKLMAEVAAKNVDAAYSGMQAAQVVGSMPQIAPIADEILKSAGYKDHNGYPMTSAPQQPNAPQPDVNANTSPMFPPRPDQAPQQAPQPPQPPMPGDALRPNGVQQGIETPIADGVQA